MIEECKCSDLHLHGVQGAFIMLQLASGGRIHFIFQCYLWPSFPPGRTSSASSPAKHRVAMFPAARLTRYDATPPERPYMYCNIALLRQSFAPRRTVCRSTPRIGSTGWFLLLMPAFEMSTSSLPQPPLATDLTGPARSC